MGHNKVRVAVSMGAGSYSVMRLLRERGARPYLVASIDDLYSVPDRVVLTGGADIAPALYGQINTYSDRENIYNDMADIGLLRYALARRIPVLGICRGCQLIAVVRGGSLHQDIERECAGALSHNGINHLVSVSGALLDRRNVSGREFVSSMHHQAIARVPIGFDVVAQADDGIIEAIHLPGVLGVQFHPEYLPGKLSNAVWHWLIAGLR